jgi:hypothetical protein
MNSQEQYREFCTGRDDIHLFMQPYWLDIVCGPAHWDAVLSKDHDGSIRGAWAFQYGTRLGFKWLRLPVATPFTGIWMGVPEDLPLQKQVSTRHEIMTDLLAQMPHHAILELKLHWSVTDWLPMYWHGYRQETRYTFRFPEVNADEIYEHFSKSFQRNLRAAERHYTITDCSAEELHPLIETVFAMRDTTSPLSFSTLQGIMQTLSARHQCKAYAAHDDDGIQAAILTVWDESTTYYLLGGRRQTDSKYGANLLLWQALQDTANRNQAFDFEGSMIEGVNKFFQSFGAPMTPYFYIYHYSGLARLKYLR